MKYDDTSVAHSYDAGRRLPDETMRLWLEALRKHTYTPCIERVLDLGCGTGRFSAGLANLFSAVVLGVDLAESMLRQARFNVSHSGVAFVRADAENLPVRDGSIDLVFMSMVYHHLPDPVAAVRETARTLKPGGTLCIRNSSLEPLSETPYLKYFPSALELNKRRLPSRQDVLNTCSCAGLGLRHHSVVHQTFADTFGEYFGKIRKRALSDLVAISDSEFKAGLQAMETELASKTGPVVEPVDLFVFWKEQATAPPPSEA